MLMVVLADVVGTVALEAVLLLAVGETVFSVLFEGNAVGVADEQAARALILIAITILKTVLPFIDFLHG